MPFPPQKELGPRVAGLVSRLEEKRFRAQLVKRQYIDKGGGKLRPLGLPTLEDKLVQMAARRVLEAIYEKDFLDCNNGYRPGRGGGFFFTPEGCRNLAPGS